MVDEAYAKKDDENIKEEVEFVKEKIGEINEIYLIKEFLSDEENNKLFKKMIRTPNAENVSELNQRFRAFYIEWRILKYLAGFVRRYAIDYDKKIKKRKQRFPLLLDKTVNSDENDSDTTVGDLITINEETPLDVLLREENSNNLLSQVRDERLEVALSLLTYKELEILSLYYIEEKTFKEIGERYKQSQNTIYSNYKAALKKLKDNLT